MEPTRMECPTCGARYEQHVRDKLTGKFTRPSIVVSLVVCPVDGRPLRLVSEDRV